MLQCREFSEEASHYIDGQLSIRKRIKLFCHLVLCACCRHYLQKIRSAIAIISATRPKESDNTDITMLAKHLHASSIEQESLLVRGIAK